MDIKIKTFLDEETSSYQGYMLGKIENNIIIYEEENINVAIIIESDKITLTRKTSDYQLELLFDLNNETEGSYFINEINQNIKLNIKTSLLKFVDNKLEIRYSVNTKEGESYFRLEYEVLK